MLNCFNKYNQISEDQYGLRKGKSTIDAIVGLVYKAVEGLDVENPAQVCSSNYRRKCIRLC